MWSAVQSFKVTYPFLIFSLAFSTLIPNAMTAEGPSFSEQAGTLEKELREREVKKRLEEIKLPEIENKIVQEEGEELISTEFQVNKIHITGSTVFHQADIDQLKAFYENQTSSLVKLKSLAKDITSYYRTRGYVTSRAIVPPQKLEGNEVEIRIYEGKVGDVKIEGLKHTKESLIRRRFHIQSGQILRYQDIERRLAALNVNPDRTVRVVMLPGEKPETTDIILKIGDRFPYHAGYGFNNLGTESAGILRQSVTATATNLLGWDDQLSTRFEISERGDFKGETANYLTPLDSRGDLISIDFSHVDIELGKNLKSFNAKGRALVFGPTLVLPFLQTQFLTGEWDMGFDYKRIRTLLSGTPFSKDDLRVFRFGPNFIENDQSGRTIFTNNFQIAFGTFMGGLDDNDPAASRPEADGHFWQYNVALGRLQNIWNGTQAIGRGSAQFSPHRLVPAQQFRLGGFDTVRGYPEGDFLGDYGYQGTFELRVPPYFIPSDWKWPGSQHSIRDTVREVAFVDYGAGFLNDPFEIELKSQHLMGIGGGLRIAITDHLRARIDWGVPVSGKSTTEGRESRAHFSLEGGF